MAQVIKALPIGIPLVKASQSLLIATEQIRKVRNMKFLSTNQIKTILSSLWIRLLSFLNFNQNREKKVRNSEGYYLLLNLHLLEIKHLEQFGFCLLQTKDA